MHLSVCRCLCLRLRALYPAPQSSGVLDDDQVSVQQFKSQGSQGSDATRPLADGHESEMIIPQTTYLCH